MKFSYTTLLDYPLADSLEHIKTADENGYYACYAADETWHKDLWLLYAAAADKTKNVRFGPNLSSVYLREPTLICQALATLDELTGGRAEGVISCGNFGMLAQYGADWKTIKPFSRVKEAHEIMRTFLDDGVITYDGPFHQYAGLFTFAGRCRSGCRSTSAPCAAPSRCSSPAKSRTAFTAPSATTRPGST